MSEEGEVRDRLTRIEGKLDLIALQHSTHTQLSERTASDHEARLRVVERARWPLPSLAVLISLGSLALALIVFARGGGM